MRTRTSQLRHDLLHVRRTVAPTRDAIRRMADGRIDVREGAEVLPRDIELDFADVYDKPLKRLDSRTLAGRRRRTDPRSEPLGRGYHRRVAYFICPNCKERSIDHDRREGLTQQAVSCHRCGFGFLFELLEDYYPAPSTGFVVCDQQARVLACGRDVFELSGFREQELMGRDVVDALGLTGFDGQNPAQMALEWGVRRLGERLQLRTRAGHVKPVTADFFPAYDEDGGLLVGLTPRS